MVNRFRTTNPRVFGSVLYGKDTAEGSALTCWSIHARRHTFDLGGLQVELEDLLGVAVDLLTLSDLPAKFRAQVLAEAVPV